jgi:hypothetical protein
MTGMDVAARMRELAEQAATGALDVTGPEARAHILLREGRMCSVDLSNRPAPGMRLVSGGSLSLTRLGAAMAAQRQHPGMHIGEVVVRMGLVSRRDVEAVTWEQMRDDIASVLQWPEPTCVFTALGPDTLPSPGPSVPDLLTAADQRVEQWRATVRGIGGAATVPLLRDDELSGRTVDLRPMDWAVLCRVDGRRDLGSIANQAGFTTFEAASVLQDLLAAGLVRVPGAGPVQSDSAWEAHAATTVAAPRPPTAVSYPEPPPPTAVSYPEPPPPTAVSYPEPPPPTAVSGHHTPAASPVFDRYDDPADLLRELSQLSGGPDPAARRRR